MLVLAHELIRDGWCQGAAARDASGRPVSPASAFACTWSAPGALERAWVRHNRRFGIGLDAFVHASLALAAATGEAPQTWNDAVGRTLPEVLDALAEAIRLVAGPPTADYVTQRIDSPTG
jgi:hypothetical protein